MDCQALSMDDHHHYFIVMSISLHKYNTYYKGKLQYWSFDNTLHDYNNKMWLGNMTSKRDSSIRFNNLDSNEISKWICYLVAWKKYRAYFKYISTSRLHVVFMIFPTSNLVKSSKTIFRIFSCSKSMNSVSL